MQVSVAVGFELVRHLGLVERLEAELLLACGTARDRGAWGCAEVRAMFGIGLRVRNSLGFTVRVRVTVS